MPQQPTFDVPTGAAAKVSIIDSTLRLSNMKTSYLMTPNLPGLDTLAPLTTWCFLVESPTGKKALFDLGVPPNYDSSFTPAIQTKLRNSGWEVKVEKHVADSLKEGGIDPGSINSVVWSHWHWDHIGDPSTFPGTTDLVVGPGFKDAFYPGYPQKPDCAIHGSSFRGRTLQEIDFTDPLKSLTIGPFRAYDFFSDGSFYLLDTPGHAIGHLAGLARTTSSPDTFIFMGGDLCHHGSEIRPSPHLPLPAETALRDYLPPAESLRLRASTCPGNNLFATLNTRRGRTANQPFFDPAMGFDIPLAIDTIKKAQNADVQDNVLFIFAHDMAIQGVVDLFPASANRWKEKGWREKTLWAFLRELIPALEDVQVSSDRDSALQHESRN